MAGLVPAIHALLCYKKDVDARHKAGHDVERTPMIAAGWLWIVFTLLASAGQTARNAMQRELTATLGTVGATHVRFLFGFPFALIFLAGVLIATGLVLPKPGWSFVPWIVLGAGAQIVATATMLMAMNDRSFVVTIAYIKTEAIQAAIFGLIFLGDRLTLPILAAILIATAGVVLMSFKPGAKVQGGLKPTLIGLFSGAMFALSAVGYRGAILSLGLPNFVLAATFTLAVGLVLQAALLTLYLALRRPPGAPRDRARLAAFAVRRLHGRDRVAVLVPRLCAHQRRQRAHVGAGRSAVRAGHFVFRIQAGDHLARGVRHVADRRRRGAVDLGAVKPADFVSRPHHCHCRA